MVNPNSIYGLPKLVIYYLLLDYVHAYIYIYTVVCDNSWIIIMILLFSGNVWWEVFSPLVCVPWPQCRGWCFARVHSSWPYWSVHEESPGETWWVSAYQPLCCIPPTLVNPGILVFVNGFSTRFLMDTYSDWLH